MIIHDLDNPLSSLIGTLDLILLKDSALSQKTLGCIDACFDYCRDLKDMILSLLEIHQMEEGKLNLDIEVSHFAELLGDVMQQFDFKARKNQVLLSAVILESQMCDQVFPFQVSQSIF
jgi:signal transduction histidine kinase